MQELMTPYLVAEAMLAPGVIAQIAVPVGQPGMPDEAGCRAGTLPTVL